MSRNSAVLGKRPISPAESNSSPAAVPSQILMAAQDHGKPDSASAEEHGEEDIIISSNELSLAKSAAASQQFQQGHFTIHDSREHFSDLSLKEQPWLHIVKVSAALLRVIDEAHVLEIGGHRFTSSFENVVKTLELSGNYLAFGPLLKALREIVKIPGFHGFLAAYFPESTRTKI